MCAIDFAEQAEFHNTEFRTARKPYPCEECARTILPGERHEYLTQKFDGRWSAWRTCQHCAAAGVWMTVVCGGYLIGDLRGELREHWHEGYTSVPFARLVVGVEKRWLDGRMPVPTGVHELATSMMRKQVA
jgi:hypothetical protein